MIDSGAIPRLTAISLHWLVCLIVLLVFACSSTPGNTMDSDGGGGEVMVIQTDDNTPIGARLRARAAASPYHDAARKVASSRGFIDLAQS